MTKTPRFLHILVSLFTLFFAGNVWAGYDCPTYKKYTSCNSGYYLNSSSTGNACLQCSSADNRASQSCTRSCSIANGTCSYSGSTQTCAGKFTGGNGGTTVGTGSCTGCSSWGSCGGGNKSITCNAKFYLNNGACSACGTGYYSAQGATSCQQCTNKPANSYYTGNAASNSCPWACNSGYHKNSAGTGCDPDCSTSKACSTLGSQWSGTYNECTGNQGTACYKTCTKPCTCATGANCTSSSTTGKTYYGNQSACDAAASTCTVNSCQSGRYKNGNTCPTCSSVGDGTYTQSAANNTAGSGSCYKSCTKACTQPPKPAHATSVTYGSTSTSGTQYYQGTCSAAASTCSMTVTACEAGYKVNASKTGCDIDGYAITYNNVSGATHNNPASYNVTMLPITFTAATKPGYTFGGWYSNSALTTQATGIPNGSTGAKTFWAKFTACGASNTAGGCNCPSSQRPSGSGCSNCIVSCSGEVTFKQGTYNECNAQNSNICYRACVPSDLANATQVNGTVTKGGVKSCTATACAQNYWVNNNVCVACVPNATCPGGTTGTPTCNNGYTWNNTTKTCDPKPYTITLNPQGGTVSPTTKTCYHGQPCTLPTPTRTDYTFKGWSTTTSCDSKGNPLTFTGAATVYACWELAKTKCEAGKWYNGTSHVACPTGYYCPGTGDSLIGTPGCRVQCTTGQMCPGGGTAPEACPAGKVCNGGNPTDCPSGSYCTGGTAKTCPDGATGSDKGRDEITDCYFTCPSPATIANGTLSQVNAKEYYNPTDKRYPACTYRATCNSDYIPMRSPGTNPICYFDGECPPGSYCEGGNVFDCPTDPSGLRGTSDGGATQISQCYLIKRYDAFKYGTGSSKCWWKVADGDYTLNCEIIPLTCDAGYHHVDGAACSVVDNGYYSGNTLITQLQCPDGYSGSDDGPDSGTIMRDTISDCFQNCSKSVSNSTSVTPTAQKVYYTNGAYPACTFAVVCATGYTVTNNNSSTPSCTPNTYTVALNKNGGSGNVVDSIKCTFNSGSCQLPATTGLTRAGFTVAQQWCSGPDGEAPCYSAGSAVTTNISATGSTHTLYAKWSPSLITVNLNNTGANVAAAPATVYLRYGQGWYSNTAGTTVINALNTRPAKTGYIFTGYYSRENGGGAQVIASNGSFITSNDALTISTTSPTTIYAAWSAGTTTCPAGQYYTNSGCTQCPENHYCPGGDFGTGGGNQGAMTCPNGGLSDAGATSMAQCFKRGLTYVATHGGGTQRCFYTSGTGSSAVYNSNCDTKVIVTCMAGYYYTTGEDCTAVGDGYYSPVDDKTRSECPDGGKTGTQTATAIQECYKTGLTYTPSNGRGTQRCFYSNGVGAAAVYAEKCDTKRITACRAGFWRTNDLADNCEAVGLGYYSTEEEVIRHACEDGGKTQTETSTAAGMCFKDDRPYTDAKHGSGVQLCFYRTGTGSNAQYDANCNTIRITSCDAGYYRKDFNTSIDCDEVSQLYYSPAGDVARTPCENGGITRNSQGTIIQTASSAASCSLDGLSCPIPNGQGEQRCWYSTGTGVDALYKENCTTCLVTECDDTYSQVGNACIICPPGKICTDDNQEKSCSSFGDGTYTKSDAGSTDPNKCYKDCALGAHATAMTGRLYLDGTSTCEITQCQAGYRLENGVCTECPEGSFCDGTSGGTDPEHPDVKSCADLGDGSWKYSKPGAQSVNDCYRTCEPYDVEYGTAIPINKTEFWPTDCTFRGESETGNPCEIIDDKCVEKSCNSSFELINGICVACNRDNALSYKPGANCEVASCVGGYHPRGQACEPDVRECTAQNAAYAEQRWETAKNAFGICIIKECQEGYHLNANACVQDSAPCVVEHGIGTKEWNTMTNSWGDCVATSCDPGYTTDPAETNERTKPCGQCKNKFSVLGEVAVSSYVRECEIASCLYQGELYNLDNNECVPICDINGYEDETGTMKWNKVTKKCERTCKSGYSMW